jgi:oxygen-independent coproporphyrinogen-3 oxidase
MDEGIGIYIHVPFCRSKCYYCDFNSYPGKDSLAGPYFDALFSEIKERSRIIGDRTVRTIFIGGGTPSYVEPRYISELLELCSRCFKIDPGAEISMESNPGTLDIDKLRMYKKAGVNRLSIGLQAWQDRLLSEIGRIHRRQQYIENFEAAAEAGFDNINTDLIFGLPGQSLEDWRETLENVIGLGKGKGLRHLSCYSLQIEEGTEFGRRFDNGSLKPADDDLDRKMYKYAVDFLSANGYRQYEISNFAEPGFECRHNLIYWKAGEYAGFGAGAHSYLNKMRFSDPADIMKYINWVNNNVETANKHGAAWKPSGDAEYIGKDEAMSEYMILGLRLTEGISPLEFSERFGASLSDVYGDKLEKLMREGLIEAFRKTDRISGFVHDWNDPDAKDLCYRLTRKGLDLANRAFVEFI